MGELCSISTESTVLAGGTIPPAAAVLASTRVSARLQRVLGSSIRQTRTTLDSAHFTYEGNNFHRDTDMAYRRDLQTNTGVFATSQSAKIGVLSLF